MVTEGRRINLILFDLYADFLDLLLRPYYIFQNSPNQSKK